MLKLVDSPVYQRILRKTIADINIKIFLNFSKRFQNDSNFLKMFAKLPKGRTKIIIWGKGTGSLKMPTKSLTY